MKTTCPKCGESYDISDKAIIEHASRSQNLRRKLSAMLGGRGGRRRLETMTPEQRSANASTAAKKRWEDKTNSVQKVCKAPLEVKKPSKKGV